jgi:hypothetical protein
MKAKNKLKTVSPETLNWYVAASPAIGRCAGDSVR